MIHELGHFVAAKLFGIQVNEFSMGMGPILFQRKFGETSYQLRLLPIGGFVSMEGENEKSEDGRAFCNKSPLKRIVVLVAGTFMNLILGLALLGILVGGQDLLGTRTIANFAEGAASSEWLQPEDSIMEVNGYSVNGYNDVIFQMMRDQDGNIDFVVLRDGTEQVLNGVQFQTQEIVPDVYATVLDFTFYGVPKTIGTSIEYTLNWTVSVVKQVWYSLIDIVSGQYGLNQLSGPVGTSTAIGEAASQGYQSLILMMAFITINVGVFNLLPLPALDGGRLLFVLVEIIIRRPVPAKYENMIHAAGFVLLMGLVLVVTFNDIMRLFTS